MSQSYSMCAPGNFKSVCWKTQLRPTVKWVFVKTVHALKPTYFSLGNSTYCLWKYWYHIKPLKFAKKIKNNIFQWLYCLRKLLACNTIQYLQLFFPYVQVTLVFFLSSCKAILEVALEYLFRSLYHALMFWTWFTWEKPMGTYLKNKTYKSGRFKEELKEMLVIKQHLPILIF